MIYGTGVDLVEISRIEKSIKNEAFLKKVYGKEELEFLNTNKRTESFAANFSAKEAFSKAIGTGIRGFRLCEVQVLRDAQGKPYYKLSGNALKLCEEAGVELYLSLTHTKEYAAAFVVAERRLST